MLQCPKHGPVLLTIHHAIEFSHSYWLKPFIVLNSILRTEATNDFDKQQYNDLSNMTKLMENVRKYREMYLVNLWDKAKKIIARPNFLRFKIFNENLITIEVDKTNIMYGRITKCSFCFTTFIH